MLVNFFKMRRYRLLMVISLVSFSLVWFLLIENKTTNPINTQSNFTDPIIIKSVINREPTTKEKQTSRKVTEKVIPEFHELPQKCKIPVLDPDHPDVKPFIKTMNARACDYPKLTEVTDDGVLQVRDKNTVMQAKFCYLRRINDNKQTCSEWTVFYDKNDANKNQKIRLKEDFIQVSITTVSKQTHDEFHAYPVRKDIRGGTPLPPKADRLNIVFLMVDSTSHSSAERYLKKTMKKMKESQSTVILNGHNIVGDGTTAQNCAIFAGELEDKLPEARRGHKKADYVDRWPFLWQDFKKAGYTTLYSEDGPPVSNTFNYRLKGFNEPPTDRYLRNFWVAGKTFINKLNKENSKCSFQINHRYFKQFMTNFHDKLKFAYVVSDLPHNQSPKVQLVDDDFLEVLEFFEKSGHYENTLLIVFGDHGDRTGDYRATMTGKLEERLPFMSFTLPPWFPEQFPDQFRNLQRNANLLTSHFDVYATLRHLMTFPDVKHKHKYGSSLFTDLSPLNRTCREIGVLDHWCSCLDYEEIKTSDQMALRAAEAIIKTINEKNAKIESAKNQCATLTLDKIIRAGLVAPGSRVQKFSHTFKDKTCDECGVKEKNDVKFKVKNYEVVFTVLPSHGKYEATAVLDISSGKFTASDAISRINMYANQPHCVMKEFPHLRPFCYCKKQLDS